MPTVLIVSASPLDQDRLRLNAEFRDIRHALQRSRNREEWTIESNEAVTVDDLRRALLDFRPSIVHFSGHGGGSSGLCFEDVDGNANTTSAEPLAKLFHHFKDDLKCVVLNACYSEVQGNIIRQEVDYVIGMSRAVDDSAAAKFAVAFYDAVFAGTDFRTAFDLGCTALDLNKLPDADVPIFMTGSHLAPTILSYSAHIPEIERILYSYFNTPFTDRTRFTTTGDSLRSIMEKYYGEKMHRNIEKVRVMSMKSLTEDQWLIEVACSESRFVYVRIRERSVLVEWEASVGLWSIPTKTYLALGSSESVVARVEAELDTYYNYDFSEQEHRFQSVSLDTADGLRLHGYVERQTEVYNKLMNILSDGNEHRITIKIIQVIKQTDMPLITEVLSRTWIYSESGMSECKSKN
ncbi:MAG: CHAT domain-containing protein [Burkholderiales bacterium]|uniref:CHAT domain-containing protein n=1 Tax=Nitrosomonas sp. TaxID=42353 RepID=UPI001D207FA2|nr:CHAT domain-containing protein [Nitrosomonas sp.]MCB1949279.1 CHAT domain-containing protein [Nitrosomonas sp.]MCP5292443.1 CHAT domain-containing protein [Burkholderiales bacterium]